jgi:hypothetical protein
MTEIRRVVLIDPLAGVACMPELAAALRAAGAEVREINLAGSSDEVLDALEQGYMPVVLKPPA